MPKSSSPLSFEDATVRMDGVYLRYNQAEDVLNDVNLDLTPGSFTFLTGPSGAGKTSLLQLIYLSLEPTRGQISLFGVKTSRANRKVLAGLRRRIGVVFQDFRLLDHLSAYENVALPLRVAGLKDGSYRSDVIDLLRWVGLGDRMDAKPQTLSGGEKQRVAIARALVNKPDLLIADEPTGNVDPEMGERIMRLFLEMNRRLNATILIATHDRHLVKRLKKPVLRLENGLLMHDTELGVAAE